MIQPEEILPETRHHDNRIVAQRVSTGFENKAINDIEVIVLKLGRCELRLELETLLANGLQSFLPGLQGDKGRSFGTGIVNKFTADPNSQVKGGRWNRRIADHEVGLCVNAPFSGGTLAHIPRARGKAQPENIIRLNRHVGAGQPYAPFPATRCLEIQVAFRASHWAGPMRCKGGCAGVRFLSSLSRCLQE